MKVETAVQVMAGLVLNFLRHESRSQKVTQTEMLLSQEVCWIESIDWYCDTNMSSKLV